MSIRIGALIVFHDDGSVIEGEYVKRQYPYYLVETGASLWRVLPSNIISINGKPLVLTPPETDK